MAKHVRVPALAIAALAVVASGAAAKAPAAKAALKCRKALGKSGVVAVKGGLKALDKCHGRRDKGKFTGDCNVGPSPQGKLAAAVQKACGNASAVLQNFAGGDAAGQIAAAIKSGLETSGRDLQGAPTLTGDKAKIKCHAAIGKGRSLIVNGIVRGGAGCQKAHDKTAAAFGPLAGDCILTAGSAGSKASGAITKACGGTSGTDVGSCGSSLPACVVDAATSTGQQLARALFSSAAGGNVPECHNGQVDPGEACDPGIGLDTDDCFDCQPERCGNGRPVASEECDDGNSTAGDGCSADCKLETPPGGSVVTVVIALTHDPALTGDVSGVEITLGYDPAKVSIPGSGDVPGASARIKNLGPEDVVLNVSDRDTNSDGQDDQLFIPYGSLGILPPGDILRAVFDGAPGASVAEADFVCTVQTAVDSFGTPVGGITCGVTVAVTTGTTTTTSTTATTTTATTSTATTTATTTTT
jgi:cysteine-rich repeat protein